MRIGHASLGESGIKNQKAGDQTQKEVCIREYYSKPWDYVLRAKDRKIAEKMAKACEDGCKNDCIGYDQNQRNTLKSQAVISNYDLSKIKVDCECDCSSFMTVCAECSGIKIPYNGSNAPTTSTMKNAFLSTGMFDILYEAKYISSPDYLMRGDILVKSGSHTVMVLDNGSKLTPKVNKKYIYGVDLSACQSSVDFAKVKDEGYGFVILRSTVKSGATDDKFEQYLKGCIDNKLDYSCYKYSYAISEDEARKEAQGVLKLLGNRKMTIWYDIENATQLNIIGASGVCKITKAFINECERNGFSVGIYCNLNWYKTVLDAELKKRKLWIARYGKNTGLMDEKYAPSVGEYVWQYTSKGMVNGIKGNVDLNVIRGN